MKDLTSRRKCVCIMSGGFHTDYSRIITESVSERLRKDNIDVCLFQALDAARYLELANYVDDEFDRHYYSQFEYSRFLRPDLIILSFGTISSIPDPVPLQEFLRHLPDVPVVLLEEEAELPRVASIVADNAAGMKACMEHLILDHGYQQILFVSGPKEQADGRQRLDAYLDAMHTYQLPLREDMIAYGNFTDHVDSLVEELLARYPHPDAIVCANDEMAESTYRVLRANGLTPGRDVAVTGFDDSVTSRSLKPPLTTVRQDYGRFTEKIIEMAYSFLRGETPSSVRLPTELVIRPSCGCGAEAENLPAEQETAPAHSAEDRLRIKQLMHNSILTSLMLRNLLTDNISIYGFFQKMGILLRSLGTRRSQIGLLKVPFLTEASGRMFLPDQLCVYMIQDGDEVTAFSRNDAPVFNAGWTGESILPESAMDHPCAVFPLFYGNVHYGAFIAEIDLADTMFYYTLSLEIGTSLRYLFLAMKEKTMLNTLEEKNAILDYSATHDPLTGLLNRNGAGKQMHEFLYSNGKDTRFVAVMADLDHLKQINDTFGHNAGDEALKAAAMILKSSLPEGSPLARTGGDEFTALFVQEGEYTPEWFIRTLHEACAAFNATHNLLYYEELSVGCVEFSGEQRDSLTEILRQTDERLYENKKQRRGSAVRASQNGRQQGS